MSLYTSLSGLRAAQTNLSTISNNIANVGTTGFKQSRATFGDIISSSATQAAGSVTGQGTQLKSIAQQFSQGSFETSDSALDVAISGEGFFVTRGGLTGGQVAYTRNGSFSIDDQNYVTDSSGNYVQVLPVNALGVATSKSTSSMQSLQVPSTYGVAAATKAVSVDLNFPSSDDVAAEREVYTADNPYAFDPSDPNSYNHVSSTTVYDSAGNAMPATVYYVATAVADPTATPATTVSTYEAHVYVGDKEVGAASGSPITISFDNGVLTEPTDLTGLATVSPSGASAPLTLTMDFTASTLSDSSFAVTAETQDGRTVAQLSNLSVGADGLVTATYSDGTTTPLGKLAMATFTNPSGLAQLGNATWIETGLSGDAKIGEAGTDGFGDLQSGALEASNVDLTEELVALISAQRNFQANAKAIETDNTLTSTIINMQR